MGKPIQLRFPPGVNDGRVVLLDARLADHTTFADLREMMGRGRLIVEEMADAPPAQKPQKKKRKPPEE